MSLGLTLVGGCSHKNNDKTVIEVVDNVKDETCLDEIISSESLMCIDNLLEYIELSEVINSLKLKRVDIDVDQFNLLSPYEIKKLIASYTNKDKSKYLSKEDISKIETELSIEMDLVNDYIFDSGYYFAEKFLLSVLKAEVLDASGLNEDCVDDVLILSANMSNVSKHADIFDYVYITDKVKVSDQTVIDALRILYKIQSRGDYNHAEYSSTDYNEGRNELIRSAIKKGMSIIPNNYTINKKGFLKKSKKVGG